MVLLMSAAVTSPLLPLSHSLLIHLQSDVPLGAGLLLLFAPWPLHPPAPASALSAAFWAVAARGWCLPPMPAGVWGWDGVVGVHGMQAFKLAAQAPELWADFSDPS